MWTQSTCATRLLCSSGQCDHVRFVSESSHISTADAITFFPPGTDTYHVARLARECSDRVYGTYARKHALDESYVSKVLTQLDHLHRLLEILKERIAFVLSPAATSAHQLPKDFEKERQYIMRACLYTLQLAWSSLCLPLYLDVKRRVNELSADGPANATDERRRTRERCGLLLRQVHETTLKAARMVAASVHGAPSLAFLTHLTQERLGSWVQILMEAPTLEQDGRGLNKEDRESDLAW